jgi:hypothetical protein
MTENETGLEVEVETVFSWFEESARLHVVTYPTGRRYGIDPESLALHFTIVTPQEIEFRAWGNMGDDRPTLKQRALELEAQEQASEPFLPPVGG